MGSIGFFTPISYRANRAPSFFQVLSEKVDDYFYLGGKKVVLIPHEKDVSYQIEWKNTTLSFKEIALKKVSYCTGIIPLIMLFAKSFFRATYHLYYSRAIKNPVIEPKKNHSPAAILIEQFWKRHIRSFAQCHGTSALYLQHFKKHGISATYPAALCSVVNKIGMVWGRHQEDIMPKTQYFRWVESRIKRAQVEKRIEFSFTADPSRIGEYTEGARGRGGEWVREVRQFLHAVLSKKDCSLSSEERQIIDETRALIALLQETPPMIVKISGGSPAYAKIFNCNSQLVPLEDFIAYVKRFCKDWEDPSKLTVFLDETLLPVLTKEKAEVERHYEQVVDEHVPGDQLEFEILEENKSSHPKSNHIPKLKFDQPTVLSIDDTKNLRITKYGFSELEEYQDSKFEFDDVSSSDSIKVTRKKIVVADQPNLAQLKKQQQLKEFYLKAFDYKAESTAQIEPI